MKQKFDWNTSTEEVEEVLKGAYNNKEDAKLTKIIKLILRNCVQVAPSKKKFRNNSSTTERENEGVERIDYDIS